jgi:hypothetical protein
MGGNQTLGGSGVVSQDTTPGTYLDNLRWAGTCMDALRRGVVRVWVLSRPLAYTARRRGRDLRNGWIDGWTYGTRRLDITHRNTSLMIGNNNHVNTGTLSLLIVGKKRRGKLEL